LTAGAIPGLFLGLGGIITGLSLFSADDHVALTVK
jgi:hypothetical protein